MAQVATEHDIADRKGGFSHTKKLEVIAIL